MEVSVDECTCLSCIIRLALAIFDGFCLVAVLGGRPVFLLSDVRITKGQRFQIRAVRMNETRASLQYTTKQSDTG